MLSLLGKCIKKIKIKQRHKRAPSSTSPTKPRTREPIISIYSFSQPSSVVPPSSPLHSSLSTSPRTFQIHSPFNQSSPPPLLSCIATSFTTMTSSSNSSSAVRSSAKHAADRIQQHLPPSNPASLSSSSLNLPSKTSIAASINHHSPRPKDRPSSTASSVSAASPSTRRSGTPVHRSQSKDFDDDNGISPLPLSLSLSLLRVLSVRFSICVNGFDDSSL